MAPATSSLLSGIPAHHVPGLVGGAAALVLVGLWRKRLGTTTLDALGGLLIFTCGVHIGLSVGHAASQPFLSLLFLADGAAYLVLAVLRPSPAKPGDRWWWRPATGLLLLGTILAYLVYAGSGREQPDPVGVIDKLAELVALGLVMLPHARSPQAGWRRRLPSGSPRSPLRGVGHWVIASAASLGLTLVTGAAIWAEDLAGAGHAHGVASCVASHQAGPATVVRPVPCTVTPAQQAAADQLVAQTRAAIAQYENVNVALAAGYRATTPDGDGVVHYGLTHPATPAPREPRTKADPSSPLDPRHPAALVYANTRHGPVLLGAMYQMPVQGKPGPDVGGALTPWHYHTNVCFSLPGLFLSGLSTPFGQCPPGSVRITTPDQLHVWTAPNPNGPFGDLDQAWARRLEQT